MIKEGGDGGRWVLRQIMDPESQDLVLFHSTPPHGISIVVSVWECDNSQDDV